MREWYVARLRFTYASNEPRAPSQLGHLDCVEERQLGRIEGKDMEISVLKKGSNEQL